MPTSSIQNAKTPKAKTPSAVSRRLSSTTRRQEIVKKAAKFFSVYGFEVGTRDLARHLEVTQPLLYRYFPSKEDLIKEIYQMVYLEVWRSAWDELLIDRSRPVVDRLKKFYKEYTDAIMNEEWMRIYFFSALRGADINKLYIHFIEERILRRVTRELLVEFDVALEKISETEELEYVWNLQSSIFYFGVRQFVYKLEPHIGKAEMIDNAVDMFTAGYQTLLKRRGLVASKKDF